MRIIDIPSGSIRMILDGTLRDASVTIERPGYPQIDVKPDVGEIEAFSRYQPYSNYELGVQVDEKAMTFIKLGHYELVVSEGEKQVIAYTFGSYYGVGRED